VDEERWLTQLAHEAIRAAIQARPSPDPSPAALTGALATPAASFVTLHADARLRGCVGNLVARDPLHRSVTHNAVGAALRDERFEPVTLEESSRLMIHISVLSALFPLQFESAPDLLDQLTPGEDGVVLRQAGRMATYLPQVWRTFADREAFLRSLCQKAGVSADAWQAPDAEVLIYRVSGFGDTRDG
jgi:AmmeMemoRadiSam system protein A